MWALHHDWGWLPRDVSAVVDARGLRYLQAEALAIPICCALAIEDGGPDDVARVLWASVAHRGDSDGTGAVTGNLLGAMLGVDALPKRWVERVELLDIVERLAGDQYALTVLKSDFRVPRSSGSGESAHEAVPSERPERRCKGQVAGLHDGGALCRRKPVDSTEILVAWAVRGGGRINTSPSGRNTMPLARGLRWIEIDDSAGVLALELGAPGVVLLALKRNAETDPTVGYWMDEQGNVLGKVEAGQA